MKLHFFNDVANDTELTPKSEKYVIMASLKCEPKDKECLVMSTSVSQSLAW